MFISTLALHFILLHSCISQSYDSCTKYQKYGHVILKCEKLGWKTLPKQLPNDVTAILVLKNPLEFVDARTLQSKRLRVLNLSQNKIKRLTADNFDGLPRLESVVLANNSITELPEDLFNKHGFLRVVNISQNFMETIPSTLFSNTKRLLFLDISRNRLAVLGSFIFQHTPQLSLLDLSHNKFNILGDNALDGIKNLRILKLTGNNLQKLPPRFSEQVPNLYSLKIDGNKLRSFPWFEFVKKSSGKLLRLNLHGNRISNVPRAFVSQLKMMEFQIGGNPLICDCELDWMRSKEFYRISLSKSDINAYRLQFHQPDKNTVKCAGPGIYTGGHPWAFDTLCDVNECLEPIPRCSKHSTCVNTPGSFECKCHKGLFGSGKFKCEDVNECVLFGIQGIEMNCNLSISRCVNTYGSYQCRCKDGYRSDKDNSCTDINECEMDLAQCPVMSKCINTLGSFRCECPSGYHVIEGKCEDINECESNNHGCRKKCYNTIGSYFCDCMKGFQYELDGECYDVDECESKPCHEYAECSNLIGSYKCRCMTGYIGDGKKKCEDVDECYIGVHRCNGNATCRNTLGSHVCRCKEGYQGDGIRKCLLEIDIKRERKEKLMRTTSSPSSSSSSSSTIVIIQGVVIGVLCLILIGGLVYVKKPKFMSNKPKFQYHGIQARDQNLMNSE